MRSIVAVLVLLAATVSADGQDATYAGRQVVSVIEEFREAGVELVYSTNLVKEDLHVAFEPEPGTPLEVLLQILKPHRLTILEESGVFVIVRDVDQAVSEDEPAAAVQTARPEIETVIVPVALFTTWVKLCTLFVDPERLAQV